MNDKKADDEAMIAKYKADAAARRQLSKTKLVAMAPLAVQPKDGVITVRFGEGAKPLSALGGVVKVLGQSRIKIPEMKVRRS
ncbi:hypothetical protein GTP46_22910 [Duganella sp. FT135W]|uniref:Uncharacterized protein n=1 Tax=Duganella flavida TaxID=2692175 RepID=A0A6L8KEH9_9BURK|nr:hypothetical protein [Duganella flavida]MYM25485.1 hypothetical protein [Duganella flavida]